MQEPKVYITLSIVMFSDSAVHMLIVGLRSWGYVIPFFGKNNNFKNPVSMSTILCIGA